MFLEKHFALDCWENVSRETFLADIVPEIVSQETIWFKICFSKSEKHYFATDAEK